MALILDGKKTAEEIKTELKEKSAELYKNKGIKPGLAVLLIGDDPASSVYVRSKEKTSKELGYKSLVLRKDSSISENEVLNIIESWNQDHSIHGILVQLPLPKHISETKVLLAIDPDKDVDGFHPFNVGKLVTGMKGPVPCTPNGIFELLKRYEIETKGKHTVVIGRSNIVGKPIANIMYQKKGGANSTVTICHSATPNIEKFTKEADILIVAIGRANYIDSKMITEGAVLVDVGINRVEDSSREKGYRIVGDIDYDSCFEKSSAITPVPGGVGRMTIAMLMKTTYELAYERSKIL
jgi:methylenetetrahydrofolate dehydrogenase (NADP+)/methenyltetrahydrofolate cyclohydrolase